MGLIGSAIGAAGSIFGGISASKAMKKIQRKSAQNIMLLPKKKTLHLLKSSLKQDAHTKSEHSFRI